MSKLNHPLLHFTIIAALALIFMACPSPIDDPLPTAEAVTVIMTVPSDQAVEIAVNTGLSATFSADMNPDTIDSLSFMLSSEAGPVAGVVECIGSTATLIPAAVLAFNTLYTVTITTGVQDLAGNVMAEASIWSFTTGTEPDLTAPELISTVPAHSAIGVAIGAAVSATFSEPLNPATVTTATFILSSSLGAVSGTVSYAGSTASFDPEAELAYSTEYSAEITVGVQDLAGNPLASSTSWTFTTVAAPDTVGPYIIDVFPADSASGLDTTINLTISFSEPVDPTTLTGAGSAVSLKETAGAIAVAGSVSLEGLIATFVPDSPLISGTEYTAKISTALEDLSGNPLAVEYAWTFTTAGVRPVMLGSAEDFVILAMTGVTVGASATIEGNIGLNALASSFVGFAQVIDGSGTFARAASVLIPGYMYALDYLEPTPTYLSAAFDDISTAYADAAGRTGGTDLGNGELGGRTLSPGIYFWSAAALITTNLILDGGPEDHYIFQIDGALTMAAAIQVLLPNGVLPRNIFWQTVGAVALGASAQLPGIVLSNAAITLGASAVVNGRLYATTIETLAASVSIIEPAP